MSGPVRLRSLSGQTIQAGGKHYQLEESLGEHADSSVTYRSSSGADVVRIYRSRKLSTTERRLMQVHAASQLVNYSFVGQARVMPVNKVFRRGGMRIWATVRKYGVRTLKDVIFGDVTPMPHLTYRVALELARGVGALHDAGISHGDLRPSNVLLGDNSTVQLADFGIAIDGPGQRFDQFEELFLSPEALQLGKRNDFASDWYSYGKVVRALYERARPTNEKEREIIWWLTSECLRLRPGERPDSKLIFAILADHPDPALDLESLRPAVYADVTSRLGLAALRYDGRILHEAVRGATEQAAVELRRTRTFRYASMDEYERVHFLATLSMKEPAIRAIAKAPQMSYAVVQIMNSTGRQSFELPLDSPEGWIDPEWAAELESDLRRDLSQLEFSDVEMDAEAENQLESARKIARAILGSDTFARSEDVVAMMSTQCPGITAEEVRTLRDMGYLVSFPVGDANVYPLFQFDDEGMPLDVVKEVSDIVGYDGSSWRRGLSWLMETPLLREFSPADWLKSGNPPDAVVESFAVRNVA